MPRRTIQDKLTDLSASITALTMVVVDMLTDDLSRGPGDPKVIGDEMMRALSETEMNLRAKIGESDYALKVSAQFASLVDQAVASALLRRAKEAGS